MWSVSYQEGYVTFLDDPTRTVARVGPLAEAPPIGGDLQNLWYLSQGEEITTGP